MLLERSIYWNGEIIGKAKINTEGLYYCIKCKCNLPDKDFYIINLCVGDSQISLGTYVPSNKEYGIVKRIPTKWIGDRNFQLSLCLKSPVIRQDKCLMSVGEPISFLSELELFRLGSSDKPDLCLFIKG